MTGKLRYSLRVAPPLLALALLAAGASSAQETSGNIQGLATDSNGAAVPNVTVTLRCECAECPDKPCGECCPSGLVRTVTTDSEGRYRLANVPPGVYVVRGEAQGFAAVEVRGVAVAINAAQSVDLIFEVGGVANTARAVGGRSSRASSSAAGGATSAGRATAAGGATPGGRAMNRPVATTLLKGRVVDKTNDDRPISGARVVLRRNCHCPTECPNDPCPSVTCCPAVTVVTDAEGRFNVNAVAGRYAGVTFFERYSKNFEVKVPESGTKKVKIEVALEESPRDTDR